MKKFINEIFSFQDLTWKHWTFILSLYVVLHIPVIKKNAYDSNLAVFQAKAFLQGNLNIENYFADASVFEDKYFVCFPPFPALLLTPLVGIFGGGINTIFISLLITGLNMFLLHKLLNKVLANSDGKLWVFLAFFFGSGYWWVVLTSDYINGFAHVVCTCLLLLILLELQFNKRPIILGLLWALAFLTRQMTIFYIIIIIYFLYADQVNKRVAFKNILLVFTVAGFCVIPYFVFNHLRFHHFLDTGYQYLIYAKHVQERINEYGLFSTQYFIYNFYHLFLKGHNVIFSGSMNLQIVGMDQYGTSLLAASPFVIFAYKAQHEIKFKVAFWCTILLILSSILLYHNNGWMQVNTQRFALDFFPALVVLIGLSYAAVPKWLFKSFVIYSIALNCLSYTIHILR
jgi:4-amino-4-deoxy-L-arabinose transferase-like glycosyltransferase